MAGEEENVEDQGSNGPAPEVIKEARSMGWRPQEQFQGDPDNWVDADEFVRRGREVLPILKHNNKRLQDQMLTRDREIGNLKASLEASQKAIKALKAGFSEANKRAAQSARKELIQQLREAREEGDVDREFELQDELSDLKEAEKRSEKDAEIDDPTPTDKTDDSQSEIHPDFKAWMDQPENSWFGKDQDKTKKFIAVANKLRAFGNTDEGQEFIDAVMEELDGGSKSVPPDKVEGGQRRGSNSGNKSFESLPAEARRACLDDADMLVGEGKAYKTLNDWKKAYTELYFEQES